MGQNGSALNSVSSADPLNPAVQHVAGSLKASESTVMEGAATHAKFFLLKSMTVLPDGNLAIAHSNCIGLFDRKRKYVSTLVGHVMDGHKDAVGIEARLKYPNGVAADEKGNLYVSDTLNNRIRYVDMKTQAVTTVAGTGEQGS